MKDYWDIMGADAASQRIISINRVGDKGPARIWAHKSRIVPCNQVTMSVVDLERFRAQWEASIGSSVAAWRIPIVASQSQAYDEARKRQLESLNQLIKALEAGSYNADPDALGKAVESVIPHIEAAIQEAEAKPKKSVCECGAAKCGGNHSDWCPIAKKEQTDEED